MSTDGTDEQRAGRRSIWRSRGRRLVTGLNVCVSTLLAGVLLVMVNYLARRYYQRWDLSQVGYYRLSERTCDLLGNLEGTINVVSFFQKGHGLHDEVTNLLKEYQYEASRSESLDLKITMVDPDRDLARTRELLKMYDVQDANVVVFDTAGRRKYVEASDIVDYALSIEGGRAYRRMVAFKGEQVFSSALQSVSQVKQPKVCFLLGHGEREMHDFSENAGYSRIARMMRRDNITVDSLLLAEHHGVPDDCDALVIAGADRRFSNAEVELLADYLTDGGRLLILLDPAVTTGLETLLESWGVRLSRDVVVDPRRTLTGRELFVSEYGEHPITRRLGNVATVFYMPRSILPRFPEEGEHSQHADRPRLTTLAACGPQGWSEMNLAQSPAVFDEGVDQAGPIPVAAAVEKGTVGDIKVELRSTRIVIVGDSDFVSNGALSSGVGGNTGFFLNALNWLLEREALIAISPKPPIELRLDMDRSQQRIATLLIVGGAPALVLVLGLFVGWVRRS